MGLLLTLAGTLAFVVGVVLLNRGGRAYRVGRLLAVAPELSLDEVAVIARAGEPRYVRTTGRVSSEEEFPDENEKPLVYRRQRLQARTDGGRWTDVDDDRVAVPFGVESRGSFIAVDIDALGEGLIVVPRVAEGVASDLPAAYAARLTSPLPPGTPVRLRVEQVAAVEQATVAGVPTIGTDGQPALSAGLGRPLILTGLAPDAAMRVLASDRRGAVRLAAGLLVTGLAMVAVGTVAYLARI